MNADAREPRPASRPVRSDGPLPWRYRCRACGAVFQMPAASGPSEEKGRACPQCASGDIRRTYSLRSEACPPGG
jgi:rRNA maturation endonuclease Nob1